MKKATFIKVSTEVYENKELSSHAIAVYVALCKHINGAKPHEPVYPSNYTLSELTRLSLTLVKKGLKELVKHQIIRREHRYKESSLTYILK